MSCVEYTISTPGLERLTDDEINALGRRIIEIVADYKAHGTVELVFPGMSRSLRPAAVT